MITALIISGILTVFIIGFIPLYNRYSGVIKKIDFAGEYRNKFIRGKIVWIRIFKIKGL